MFINQMQAAASVASGCTQFDLGTGVSRFEILYRDEHHKVRYEYVKRDGRTMDQVWAEWCAAHPKYYPISIGPK